MTLNMPYLLAGALVLAACGDSSGTTATDGHGGSTGTTGTTSDQPTTGATGSSSGDATGGSGSITGTTGDTTTDATTDVTMTASTGVSATSGDTTDATSGGTGDTTGGGIDDLPTSCLDVDFPVDAPLCGSGGPACALKRDEVVSPNPKFRNDMPAIALRGDCGPAVLYSEAVGGYHGFYAERTGPDAWTAEATPMDVATGSLEHDPGADEAIAMVDDGAFGSTLWRRVAGAWKKISGLAGMNHNRAPQLLRDKGGKLHLGHIDSDQTALYDMFDGTWTTKEIDKQADIHVRLALDAAVQPHLTYWSSKEATWKLYYAAPPAAPETVTPLNSNVLERAATSLALAGPDDTPWVLVARKQQDQQHHDLVLLHRAGPAKWAEELVAAEDPVADKTCEGEPGGPGQTCDYDYVVLFPLALVATASGEVRAIYDAINFKGTMISQCMPMPFPICVWVPQSDTSTAELRVAWPGSKPQEHQVVATDVFTDRATARLDPGGNIHLAFYDRAPGTEDPIVRYLAFGP